MNKPIVLIVDDIADNIDVLRGILRDDYKVKAVLSGKQALELVQHEPKPDIILLDVMMPEMSGHEVCKRLKENPTTSKIPIIFVTAREQIEDEKIGFSLGAVDYISKPVSAPIVKARVAVQIALHNQNRELEKQVSERTAELEDTRLEIIRRLGRAAEYKDNETGTHVIRMSWFARFIAEELGANKEWVDLIFHAAPMHDVGKIGIPDNILLKPEKLNEIESKEMKRHSVYGARIIGVHESGILAMAREVALYHHEKWDGSGYPKGLAGEDIPLSARIIAIADVFDALSSERCYKKAWTEELALAFIEDEAGKHFDPSLVPLFIRSMPRVREIQARYSETNEYE